jgi:hypothetical protein
MTSGFVNKFLRDYGGDRCRNELYDNNNGRGELKGLAANSAAQVAEKVNPFHSLSTLALSMVPLAFTLFRAHL